MRLFALSLGVAATLGCSTGEFASKSDKKAEDSGEKDEGGGEKAKKGDAKKDGKDKDGGEGASAGGESDGKDNPTADSEGGTTEGASDEGGGKDPAMPPFDQLAASPELASGTNYIIIYKNNANATLDDHVGFREYDSSWPRELILNYGYGNAPVNAGAGAFGSTKIETGRHWSPWTAADLQEPAVKAYLKDRIETLRAVVAVLGIRFPSGYDPTAVDLSTHSDRPCESYNSKTFIGGDPTYMAIPSPRLLVGIESGGGKDGSKRRTWLAREGDPATTKCGGLDLAKWPEARKLLKERAKRSLVAPAYFGANGALPALGACPVAVLPYVCKLLE